MKHRQWFFLGLSLLALAVALVGVRSFSGPDAASAHVNTGTAHVEIDMVKDGSAWCNPVDTSAIHAAGVTYQVAICLSDSADYAPQAFNFDLLYDDTLNSCADVDQGGTYLDDNPDANDGTTTWTSPDLGTGWDCAGGAGGLNQPACDKDAATGAGHGDAFMTCLSINNPTLPFGAGVSSPLAVVTFTAAYGGTDNLAFGTIGMYGVDGEIELDTFGATDEKTGSPAPTATDTPPPATPTITNTPCPDGICPTSTPTTKAWTKTPTPTSTETPAPSEPGEPGEPAEPPPPPPTSGEIPAVVPPGTGTGPGSVGWTTSLIWTLVGAGALSVFLGGLHFRRAKNR